MRFKYRAAAVVVATSLVAVPLALAGTALAQEDSSNKSNIGGIVFKDLNGDGVRQDAEPGIGEVIVIIRNAQGEPSAAPTDGSGRWTAKLPYGQYGVSYVDPKLGNTTPSNVKVDLNEADGPTVNFGLRGGSICGVAWNDANEDGNRQADEAGLAGRIIAVDKTPRHAVTGTDGGYCLEDLEAGDYTLAFSRKSDDPLVPTKPDGDSRFDWATARTQLLTVGKGGVVKNIDLGLMKQRTDLKAAELTFYKGPETAGDTFKVGDEITIYGSVLVNGNAPQAVGGTLIVPMGLRILGASGGLAQYAIVQGQQVTVPFGPVRLPGQNDMLGVRAVVEKGFTGGEVRWEVGSSTLDADLTNNVLTRPINVAVVEQPERDHGPAVVEKVALANTGVSPVVTGAVGLGVAAIGGLVFFAARRRHDA